MIIHYCWSVILDRPANLIEYFANFLKKSQNDVQILQITHANYFLTSLHVV